MNLLEFVTMMRKDSRQDTIPTNNDLLLLLLLVVVVVVVRTIGITLAPTR